MIDFTAFTKEVHTNATAHGWWDEPRTFGEIISLCHSELSEALEEFRNSKPMIYCDTGMKLNGICQDEGCIGVECWNRSNKGKPEGIAVELADCIIRILDWFGQEAVDPAAWISVVSGATDNRPFGEFIADLHFSLSAAYAYYGDENHLSDLYLAECVNNILIWAKANGVDMPEILRIKHEYNKTRPYRHGGKAL